MPDLSKLQDLVDAGYFVKVAQGDHRASGLFTRLAAYYLNRTGDPYGWGCLTKPEGSGKNVEGYSEDSIVLGDNPANLQNVCDIINGAGAKGATLNAKPGFVNRRPSDKWEKPKPLTSEQSGYLLGDVVPGPNPTPTPKPPPPPPKPSYPGDRVFDAVGRQLEADYVEAGQTLNAQSATWFARVIWDHLNEGLTLEASIAKHRAGWRAALGL